MNTTIDACVVAIGVASSIHSLVLVRWLLPSYGFVKLNTDGSSLGNLVCAGFGGLIRGMVGEWILDFSSHVPWVDNLCVELLALRFGLMLAWQQGMRKVIVKWITWWFLDWYCTSPQPSIVTWL